MAQLKDTDEAMFKAIVEAVRAVSKALKADGHDLSVAMIVGNISILSAEVAKEVFNRKD